MSLAPLSKILRHAAAVVLLGVAAGCSHLAIDEADRLSSAGEFEQAYAALDAAAKRDPADAALRTAQARARDRVVLRAVARAELALSSGRDEEARQLLQRVRDLDPGNPRLAAIEAARQVALAAQEQAASRRSALAAPRPAPAAPALGPAFQKPVTLEFRDAPLRQVLETLSRTTSINFVFDKDVRADTRITTFLRGVTLDEALRLILASQQLDRKVVSDNTVFVYPNTPAKQREHQELVTRSLYLTNADVKQALQLVRTMAKTRDLHADERLNALVVRDTPEVVAMIEKLVATIDLPDPEVTMAVEILEVATSTLENFGLGWPQSVAFGLPDVSGSIRLGDAGSLRGYVGNPALVAQLRATLDTGNLLANPTVRARNREKAKVQIGEKLPLFTTTSATVNVGASTTVTLIDVGLKLDLEPQIQLDGDVVMKISLEVSNLLREVAGPNGSSAYQLGTRLTTTSLRLKDGETQVLAGLIKDEDRKGIVGLPRLSQAPLLGRLFGVHTDQRDKTEIVMLITPHIVRNLPLPDAADATLASGTDAMPGTPVLRLRSRGSVGVAPATGGARAAPAAAAPEAAAPAPAAAGALVLSASAEAGAGETVSVTLANRSGNTVQGELEVDPAMLRSATGGDAAPRVPFTLAPQAEAVLVFRVLPAAAGTEQRIFVASATGTGANGQPADVAVEGSAVVRIRPAASARP